MDFFWHIVVNIGYMLPIVLGYNLVFGRGKILHFGQEGTALLASYSLFLPLYYGWSVWLTIPFSLLVIALFSLFLARLAVRLPADAFAILSIALHLILLALVLNSMSLTRGALGISGIARPFGIDSTMGYAWLCAGVAVAWLVLILHLERSAFGRALAALAQQPQHAEALGINRFRVTTIAFGLAGAGAWLTAALYPPYVRLLHPNDYTFPFMILIVMMTVAGGPGSTVGVAIATTVLIVLKESLRLLPLSPDALGALRLIFFGGILLSALWIQREKLFPPPRAV